jgi:hypothetical protein
MADPAKKQALIASLHEARGQMGGKVSELREDFSVGKRFRRSVRLHPGAWYAGAAVVGLVLSRLGSRKKEVVVPKFGGGTPKAGKAALGLGVLKILIDLSRPFATAWLKQRFTQGPPPRRGTYSREHDYEYSDV